VAAAKPDPLAAWRPTRRTWLGLALLAGALVVYPWAIDAALARFGARPVAAVLLALALASGAVPLGGAHALVRAAGASDAAPRAPGRAQELALPRVPGASVAVAGLLLVALLTGDLRALFLVPAAVYLWLALLCVASLREPPSLIERAARFLQPRAPDFIGSYCRKVTALWAALFAANAAAIAWLVFAGTPEARRAFSAWGVWTTIGVVSVVEYFVRKSWFRYYAGGGLDHLWAALLPAENTERGRRSLAYIREKRAEMRAAGYAHPRERRP
jgi:uncharacterized membrane protein